MRRWKLSIIMHEMIKVPLGRYQATCTRVPKGFSAGLCEGRAKGVGVGGGGEARFDSIGTECRITAKSNHRDYGIERKFGSE